MTDPQSKGTYFRIAAVGMPILLVALGCFMYRDFVRPPMNSRKQRTGSASTSEVFSEIYKNASWGKNAESEGNSGTGSTLSRTVVYRAFLQVFLKEHDIRSVVDAGCGDWEFSQAIDWTGIEYKGYDIVPSIIEKNIKKYAAPNIMFFTADIVKQDLPPADLLLCKHVLQHLPNRDIAKFLTRLPKYKYVLLTDGIDQQTLSAGNKDIKAGDYRTLDLTRPPFGLHGTKVLSYFDGEDMSQVVYIERK